MKRQIIDIVSSDDEDFEDLGRTSGRVLQNPRVKRSLGLNFGGGSIQSGDTHRADSALPLSSSGVAQVSRFTVCHTPIWRHRM